MEQLTKENQEYLKTMSRLFEKEPAALLNNIIESHRKKNAEIYERARAAGEGASGNISIFKVIGAKAAPERIGKEPDRIPDSPAARFHEQAHIYKRIPGKGEADRKEK